MHKSRLQLEEILTALFMTHNFNKNIFNNMRSELSDKILPGKLSDIFDQRIKLRFVSDIELCLVVTAFYNQIKDNRINPTSWFTKQEILSAEKVHLDRTEEKSNVLVLHNVDQVKSDQWISSHESYKNIAEYFNRGLITYNQDIQREGVKKIVAGEKIIVPKIIPAVVEEIARKMREGSFVANMITLNIISENNENIIYDNKNRTLSIVKDEDTEISIIDGSHRCFSIIKVMSEIPHLEEYMVINILNYDVRRAQAYIYQEAQRTEIDPELLKTFNNEDKYMDVAIEINKSGSITSNMLFNKLGKTYEDIEKFGKYCLMVSFSSAIEDNFREEAKNPRSRRMLVAYLIEFFNETISLIYDEFSNLEKVKDCTVLLENNMFYGYLYIAKKLYHQSGWQIQLEELLGKVNWGRTNADWFDIKLFSKKLTPKARKGIYSYFESVMEDEGGKLDEQ